MTKNTTVSTGRVHAFIAYIYMHLHSPRSAGFLTVHACTVHVCTVLVCSYRDLTCTTIYISHCTSIYNQFCKALGKKFKKQVISQRKKISSDSNIRYVIIKQSPCLCTCTTGGIWYTCTSSVFVFVVCAYLKILGLNLRGNHYRYCIYTIQAL